MPRPARRRWRRRGASQAVRSRQSPAASEAEPAARLQRAAAAATTAYSRHQQRPHGGRAGSGTVQFSAAADRRQRPHTPCRVSTCKPLHKPASPCTRAAVDSPASSADDSAFRFGPGAHRRRQQRCRGAAQFTGTGATRRTAGLPPLLGGRAPQHGRGGQFGHRGVDRLHRRRHQQHSCRQWRRHASQPCATGHCRTVRYAGHAVPGAHRPGPGPRAGYRPPDDARAAPPPVVERRRRRFSARRDRVDCLPGRRTVGHAGARDPRHRHQSAGVAAGQQPVQRSAGGVPGAAVCICFALRTRPAAAGTRDLPRKLQAIG